MKKNRFFVYKIKNNEIIPFIYEIEFLTKKISDEWFNDSSIIMIFNVNDNKFSCIFDRLSITETKIRLIIKNHLENINI